MPYPYIITTHPSDEARTLPEPDTFAEHDAQQEALVTRRAVATLDGEIVAEAIPTEPFMINGSWNHAVQSVLALPESGGTIELPDGTVIEVKPVEWADLARQAGHGWRAYHCGDSVPRREHHRGIVLDAYNTTQEA